MFSLRLYRHALRLYPAYHRERFSEEMVTVFASCRLKLLRGERWRSAGFASARQRVSWAEPCTNIGESGAANISGYCFLTGGLRCTPNSVFRKRLLC
jgi:hypothetical protein